jgi:hypothetical protein
MTNPSVGRILLYDNPLLKEPLERLRCRLAKVAALESEDQK